MPVVTPQVAVSQQIQVNPAVAQALQRQAVQLTQAHQLHQYYQQQQKMYQDVYNQGTM